MSSTDSILGFISAGVDDDTTSLLESLNMIKQRQMSFTHTQRLLPVCQVYDTHQSHAGGWLLSNTHRPSLASAIVSLNYFGYSTILNLIIKITQVHQPC